MMSFIMLNEKVGIMAWDKLNNSQDMMVFLWSVSQFVSYIDAYSANTDSQAQYHTYQLEAAILKTFQLKTEQKDQCELDGNV